jgi:glycosyltransferase involved in cell wall biosynthesis
VGRLDATSSWKGVDVLLRAFALLAPELPACRLSLVGDGDALEGHRALARELGVGDRVVFRGSLTGEALVAAYQQARAVVLPSLTEAESFGMVLVEAMACGTPVIGSDVGGIPFVIADGVTGLLAPPADPAALAARCRQLLLDDDLATRLGAAGRRAAVERFAWQASEASYLRVVREALGLAAPAAAAEATARAVRAPLV